jgi:hypothetical protein
LFRKAAVYGWDSRGTGLLCHGCPGRAELSANGGL